MVKWRRNSRERGRGTLFSRDGDGDGLVSDPLKVGATNGGICLESNKRADHLNADLTLVMEASVFCWGAMTTFILTPKLNTVSLRVLTLSTA
jgi:hypothetical protein